MPNITCPVDEHLYDLPGGGQDCFADMTCPTGQHPIINYANRQICAPNVCPVDTHMGWSTNGLEVICAPNAVSSTQPPQPTTPLPIGYTWAYSQSHGWQPTRTNQPPVILPQGLGMGGLSDLYNQHPTLILAGAAVALYLLLKG